MRRLVGWSVGIVTALGLAAWWQAGAPGRPRHDGGDALAVHQPPAANAERSMDTAARAAVVGVPPGPAASVVAAQALMADYRDSGGRSQARHAGKRLMLQGAVAAVEAGANGLVLVSLDAGPDLPPARAVMAARDAGQASGWAQGLPVALDCANQGLLMGEPVLADCRILRR